VVLALAQPAEMCAQTPSQPITPTDTQVVTQQETNQRILDLAKNTHTPPHDYVVGRGDLVAVEVFDVPELTREVRVSQTGTIGLPLIPVRLYVMGLTEIQVQQKVAEVLEVNGLVSRPQVMVSVKEKRSKSIAVVGAVAHPMVYWADRPVTLVEVLAEAGGINNDAGDTVIVTRQESTDRASAVEPPEIGPEDAALAGDPSAKAPGSVVNGESLKEEQKKETTPGSAQSVPARTNPASSSPAQQTVENLAAGNLATGTTPPDVSMAGSTDSASVPATITVNLAELLERGDTQNNITLQAGDVVTVPHAGIVYALGAVSRPGGFVATNDRAQLSTLKILALAGGLTSVAKKDHAVIIRKDSNGTQQEIPVDLGKIVKRESEDVRLMPSDILYVPPSGARAALIRASEIAVGVGTSVAIYRIGQH
jgi:protein involved in polysaccharide export with SLBB domain